MHRSRPFLLSCCLALLTVVLPAGAASQAGKVVYAFGDVRAVADSGTSRALGRGDVFGAGDTIVTRQGRAQLRFTDGGFAALQPDTEYRIEDYHFEGQADGRERSFLNLLRGSVRLVTGLIGRANKQNFRLRTPVATIGIRGTSGKISHCDANCGERGPGTRLAGYGGEWDLSSGAFSGPVKPGQAKFCNGASCFDIPGFGQRSDVDSDTGTLAEGDQGDDGDGDPVSGPAATEPVFQAGVQTTAEGLCVLGNCAQAEILVATGQSAAAALTDGPFDGDLGSGENLAVVLRNGEPIAVVDLDTASATGTP
ncbi:MAG: FecR family protein, partial [Gammaproteobacteria bacterium]